MSVPCETPMSDHINRFWELLATEHVRILIDIRRDHDEGPPHWDSASFPNDVAKALVADRNQPDPQIALESERAEGWKGLAYNIADEVAGRRSGVPPSEVQTNVVEAIRTLIFKGRIAHIKQSDVATIAAALGAAQAQTGCGVIAAIDPFTRGAFTGWKDRRGFNKITLDEAEDHFSLCMADMMDAARAASCAQAPTEPVERTYLRGWNEGIEAVKELLERDGWLTLGTTIDVLLETPPIPSAPAQEASDSGAEIKRLRAQVEYWRLAAERREARMERSGVDVAEARTLDTPSVPSASRATPCDGADDLQHLDGMFDDRERG